MMLMYSREVVCGARGCGRLAEYKVAAPWSAGKFSELKTYGLACAEHHAEVYHNAVQRRATHTLSPEESQGTMGLYHFEPGKAGAALDAVPPPE